jgi:PBP1b-binding outer membrane lipoprotein LpoB
MLFDDLYESAIRMPAVPAAPRAPTIANTIKRPKTPRAKPISQQVSEMIAAAQSREDVQKLKKFIDTQTQVNESVRALILEHVTQLVAVRRRQRDAGLAQ